MSASSTPADVPVLSSRLPKGTVVGRHVVDGWVRDGGMAVIYRGRHVQTNAKVAIKVMAVRYAADDVLIARFEREGEVMGRLSNVPGVVGVHDAGTLDDGRRYLVMEWIEGQDLDELLNDVRSADVELEIDRACRLARDVARGIAAAHERQVVHRDLKPANIMVDRAGGAEVAKVVDFGVSADLGSQGRDADLTQTGVALGTSGYMAPEQALGLRADPSFDVWALGMLLFELLTNTPVPPGVDPSRLPDVRTRRPKAPVALSRLIKSCLLLDMRRRPSATAFASKLEGVLAQLALDGVAMIPDDDRPEDTFGAIEGTDPGRPLIRRSDIEALGLRAPARLTPVRVKAVPRPADSRAAAQVDAAPPPEKKRTMLVVAVLGVAMMSIIAAVALWPGDGGSGVQAAVASGGLDDEGALLGVAKPDAGTASAGAAQASASRGAEPDPPVSVGAVDSVSGTDGVRDDGADADGAAPAEEDDGADPPEADDAGVGADAPPAEDAGDADPKPSKRPSKGDRRPSKADKRPTAPAHTTERCKTARDAAAGAKSRRQWKQVLANTRDRSCWTRGSDRTLLRVTAFAELGRYDDCVRAGSGSVDARVATRTKFCRKKQEAG